VRTQLVDLLRTAIADRVSEGAGIVLSGGLDSSTVACLAPQPMPMFTGYYFDEGFDERFYARLAAGVNGGEHHEIPITPRDFVEHFDALASALSGPALRQGMGAFGQYMVARHAADYISVLLSGEGSDELFGGYARTLLAAGEPAPLGYEDYKPPADYPLGDLAAALDYDWQRLPDLLAVDEQTCAAWGVEGRAPFTDPTIVEYALALPPTERVGKRHLRAAVRGLVPEPIVDRQRKMGFPVPLVAWCQREPVRTFVMDRIGYIPAPADPFDRTFWYDLLAAVRRAHAA
jgi:asparagine synthetase B (glutamine-hydrolysing)